MNYKHGESKGKGTPEYRSWLAMRDRCERLSHHRFADYGGRGIKVCYRWRLFEHFLVDMGRRPSPAHTLERKDTNGDYEPCNCIWATRAEQNRNKRSNVTLTLDGLTLSLIEWAKRSGIPYRTLHMRHATGWSDERALTEPVRRRA